MLPNRSNLPLCQVSMFNTSPISRKCDITVRTCKLFRHIIPLEEIDRNCLQLSYALFFGLIHISLTFSERDVGTALSYRDKNYFGASVSRKTNFKSSIWKWHRRHFRKLLEVERFSLRDVTMAKIVGTNKLPSSPPPHPPPPDWVPTNGFVTFLQVRWPLHALTRNLRWNVCNEIQAADIQSTWRLAEAEFIIINRNNIKLFHFTISGDRNIIFFKLIFHVFVWIPLQFRQMNAFTRQHFQDSTLPSRW